MTTIESELADQERRMIEAKRQRDETEAERLRHAREVDLGHKRLKRARKDAADSGQTALLKAWQNKSPLDVGSENVPSDLTSSVVLTELAKTRGSLRKSAKFRDLAGRLTPQIQNSTNG